MNVNWIKLASDLIREAVGTTETRETPAEPLPPPSDLAGVFARHRAEIDRNFETLAQMINALNERQLKAMQAQRKWNYGLLAALVIIAIVMIATYWRG
jgi:hypothetical protein